MFVIQKKKRLTYVFPGNAKDRNLYIEVPPFGLKSISQSLKDLWGKKTT